MSNLAALEAPLAKRIADHIEDISEDMIFSDIEDIKEDYLSSDWESEFEDVFSAYEELGRGEAESHVMQKHAVDVLGPNAEPKEIASFMQEMAYQLDLSLN